MSFLPKRHQRVANSCHAGPQLPKLFSDKRGKRDGIDAIFRSSSVPRYETMRSESSLSEMLTETWQRERWQRTRATSSFHFKDRMPCWRRIQTSSHPIEALNPTWRPLLPDRSDFFFSFFLLVANEHLEERAIIGARQLRLDSLKSSKLKTDRDVSHLHEPSCCGIGCNSQRPSQFNLNNLNAHNN